MSSMQRRDFLRRSAIAAAALTLAPPRALRPFTLRRDGRPQERVLVIGAGMAGMAAALELADAGHDVTVLEARLRPGGRVHTLRDGFADGLYAEAGAARIPTSHDLTLGYAERFGLETAPFQPDRPKLFRLRDRTFPQPEAATADFPLPFSDDELGATIDELVERGVGPMLQELGDPTATGWPHESLAEYDAVTIAESLRRVGASEAFVEYLDLGADVLRRYSALEGLLQIAGGAFDPLVRIVGGTDRLPGAMAERLGRHIVYGAPVVRIEHGEDDVAVVARRGTAHRRFTADRLIVTIPFTVLRDIELSPRFSPAKMRAIEEMSYENVSRVFLQTGARFWRESAGTGFALTDDPMEIWDATFGQPGRRGILMGYMRGGLARRVARMEASERIRFGVERIGHVFPALPEHYEGGTSWAWGDERWSRGAFAFAAPGEIMRHHHAAGESEGRVHFAGEHTSVWPGWIQGAVHSGLRAAREVAGAEVAS